MSWGTELWVSVPFHVLKIYRIFIEIESSDSPFFSQCVCVAVAILLCFPQYLYYMQSVWACAVHRVSTPHTPLQTIMTNRQQSFEYSTL